MHGRVIDITGQRFGSLTALRFVGIKNHFAQWECRCDCGNTAVVRGSNLRSGVTRHCRIGCDGRPEWIRERERAFKEYIESAQRREIPFRLTLEEFELLAQQPCYYCGELPAGDTWPHNGVDRLDPKGCYVAGNVVPCCSSCNYAKGSMNYNDFLDLIARVYSYRRLGAVVDL